MTLPTLDTFLKKAEGREFPLNSYVREPGFRALYVRVGPRFLGGRRYNNVVDIARVEAGRTGQGRFTALVNRLLDAGYCIYVEAIFNERLVEKLVRMGFQRATLESGPPSMYKLTEKHHGPH